MAHRQERGARAILGNPGYGQLGRHTPDPGDPLRRNRHTPVAIIPGQLSKAVLATQWWRRFHPPAANPSTPERSGRPRSAAADLQ